MAEKLLEVKNLRTEFKRDKTWVTAVNNVSFSIQPGEILGLVGESGCGKSVTSLSIMKLLARNSKISNGEILLNGKDLLKEDKKGMRKIRGREVAMIFQEPMNSLNPCMRIEKQLTEAILLHNNFSKEEAHNRAFEVLKSVGIPEPDMTLKSYPHQLSGGMCQRVMIAMAMSCEPELLIADEPTTALDVTIQAQILELMEDIRAKKNTGILMITHDLGVVAEMCSRVVVIMDEPTKGVDVGAKAEIYAIMGDLAKKGYAIILISSEMPEILGMSDRIVVMCNGRKTGELGRGEATQEMILELAMEKGTTGKGAAK